LPPALAGDINRRIRKKALAKMYYLAKALIGIYVNSS
jgi:hypothetical protein